MNLSTERGKLQVCRCGAQQHRICIGPAEATKTPQSFCKKRQEAQYSDSEEKERAMGGLTHYKVTELCRSARVAGLFLRGIRSRSELKERRLISDSRYPGGFSA